MAISVTTRERMVACFTELVPHEVYNIGHLVLDDLNLDRESIQFAVDYAEKHIEEYVHDHGVFQEDAESVIAFLKFLITLPEPEFVDPDDNYPGEV